MNIVTVLGKDSCFFKSELNVFQMGSLRSPNLVSKTPPWRSGIIKTQDCIDSSLFILSLLIKGEMNFMITDLSLIIRGEKNMKSGGEN